MNLFLRQLQVYLRVRRDPKFTSWDQEVRQTFRVLPTDVDLYKHMNHARYLQYMEATRLAIQIRTGLLRIASKERWSAPIIRVDIRYYKSLKAFEAFEVTAKIIGF